MHYDHHSIILRWHIRLTIIGQIHVRCASDISVNQSISLIKRQHDPVPHRKTTDKLTATNTNTRKSGN